MEIEDASITQRTQAENEPPEDQARFRSMLDGSRDVIYRLNLQTGRFEYVSPSARDVVGFSPEEFAAMDVQSAWAMVHPEDHSALRAAVARLETTGHAEVEYRQRTKDGDYRWLSNSMNLRRDGSGRPLYRDGSIRDITDRKRAEEELRQSEKRYRMLHETMRDAFVLVTMDGRIVEFNDLYCQMLGYTPEEVRTLTYQQVTPERWHEAEARIVREQIIPRGYSDVYEKEYRRKNGTVFPVELRTILSRDERGQPNAMWAIARDITARKEAEKLLQESERNLAEAQRIAGLGSWQWDHEHDRVWWSKGLYELLLLDPNLPAPRFAEQAKFFSEESLERLKNAVQTSLQTGRPYELDLEMIRTDGSRLLVMARGEVLRDEAGKIRGFRGTVLDITERKRAEEALAAAHRQTQSLIDNTTSLIYAFDLEERFILANAAVANLLHSTPQQLIGKRRHEFMPKEDADWHEANDRKAIEAGQALEFEESSELQDRSITWLTTKFPLRDAQGRIYAVAGTSADITDRKQAEAALARERDLLQSVLNSAGRAHLVYLDRDFNFVRVNNTYAATCGYRPDEMIGKNHFALYPNAENETIFRRVRDSGEPSEVHDKPFEFPDQPERGVTYWDWTLIPVKDAGGQVTGLIFSLFETTARKQAEQALAEAKAIAESANRAKDQFIAVLSHELRTPLTPALAAASMLETDPRLPEDVRDDLATVRRNIDLEVRLIGDLLDVSRIIAGKLHLDRQPVDVAGIIRDAARIVSGDLLAKNQTLTIDTPGAPYPALGDAARLQQVIWNLLRNAIKFSPEHGRIAIRAQIASADGGSLLIEVIDQGSGIAPDMLPKLFDAFEQEDKARGFGGLGLGLTICKGILEMHGGSITAHSDGIGRGATFTIRLPLAPGLVPGGRPPLNPDAAAGKSAHGGLQRLRIVLVEDHPDTARLMGRVLKAEGHEVFTATTVADGMAAVLEQKPDVLISDLGLPDGNGLDLLRRLQDQGRRLPAIALSGYGQEHDLQQSREAGFTEHLVKPVSLDHLRRAIQQALR